MSANKVTQNPQWKVGTTANSITNRNTGTIDIDSPTLDLSTQTLDVTLNNAVDALNFDSNTLSIDALNNRVGIGTAAPTQLLQVGTTLYVNNVSTRFGVGVASPSSTLDVGGIINTSSAYTINSLNAFGVSSDFLQLAAQMPRGAQANYLTAGPIDQIQTATLFSLPNATTQVAAKFWGVTSQTANIFEVSPYGGTTKYFLVDSAGNVGIGTTGPDRKFHTEVTSALTNTVQQVARLTHITSGTPANSIGVGLEFEQETSANNNEIVATIETILTDVTATSEDADIVLKTMSAGATAAECARFSVNGLSFFGGAIQAKQAHIIDADGTLADLTTKFNTLLADLEGYGLLASS